MKLLGEAVVLTRAELGALLAHGGQDPVRPHYTLRFRTLAGVAEVAATDGHRAARVRVEMPPAPVVPDRTWLIGRLDAEKAHASRAAEITFLPGHMMIDGTVHDAPIPRYPETAHPTSAGRPIEFPPVDQIIPVHGDDVLGLPSALDPFYLADLLLVAKAITSVRSMPPHVARSSARLQKQWRAETSAMPSVVMHPAKDEGDPVAFTFEGAKYEHPVWLVVIMPRRTDFKRESFEKIVRRVADALPPPKTARVS